MKIVQIPKAPLKAVLMLVVMMCTFSMNAYYPSASTSYAKDAKSIVIRGYDNINNSIYNVYYINMFNMTSQTWNIALIFNEKIVHNMTIDSVDKIISNSVYRCNGHDTITDEDFSVDIFVGNDFFKITFLGKKTLHITVDKLKNHPKTFVLFNDHNTLDPEAYGWKQGNPKKFKEAMKYILNQKLK